MPTADVHDCARRDREERLKDVRVEMQALDAPRLDPRAVAEDLARRLADWRGLLTRHAPQARQILRKLLPTPYGSRRTANGSRAFLSSRATQRSDGSLPWGCGARASNRRKQPSRYGGVPDVSQLEPDRRLAQADRRASAGRLSACRSGTKAVQ